MRVIDLFDRAAAQFALRDCLIDRTRTLTYEEVWLATHALAQDLARKADGFPKRVGVLAPNCAAALIAILGVMRAGAVWIPANGRLPPSEIGAFLHLAECELLLVHPSMAEIGLAAATIAGCATSSLAEPNLEREQERFGSPHSALQDEACSVFATGGTTGAPKAAIWTHRTWTAVIANFHAGIRHDDHPVHLVATPLTHAAGVIAIPLFAIGATHVILERAEPGLVLETIERYRVTTLFLPPTVIYAMLAHPDLGARDTSSLQNLIYAAAPMSIDKLKEARLAFGPVLIQTYGQAEAPMVCTILGRAEHEAAFAAGDDARLASCGRPGLLTELTILDGEGAPMPVGETGEIAVRGDLLMRGYYGDPNIRASSDWHRTGDIGRVDSEGYVTISDRSRDLIITGGFNVYPSTVEQVLWGHPAVQDCAVIGAPDENWGEAVVAVVELKPGVECTETELVALCKERLGSIRAPKRIEFWDELPRSAVGKVLKRSIRERFWVGRDRII